MLNGTLAKFTQNVNLARKLINTGENGLFEATTDKFFGAGVGLGSNLWATGKWSGKNAAGKICMSVRNLLNEEISKGTEIEDVGNNITYPVSAKTLSLWMMKIKPQVPREMSRVQMKLHPMKRKNR